MSQLNSLRPLALNPDRLFTPDPSQRGIAQRLYNEVKNLPIISPHGHTDPQWFADNENFGNASELFIKPDHYVFRMLYSLGVPLEKLGIPTIDDTPVETDSRAIWKLFADYYYSFRGTPTRMWMDYVFKEVFGMEHILNPETADTYYDQITEQLASEDFRPRQLFDRFKIECLATTESPLDDLKHHKKIRESGWAGNVITAYRLKVFPGT